MTKTMSSINSIFSHHLLAHQNQTHNHATGYYAGQSVLASTPSQEVEDFVGTKFYCLHALVDDN